MLSLLNQRIAALVRGAIFGDTLGELQFVSKVPTGPSIGRTLLLLADEVVRNEGNVRQTFKKAGILNKLCVGEGPIWFDAAGLAMPIGIIRRPQDHNGIVDDVITAIVWSRPTSVISASACALAATIAALLDGWGMEGAMDLALFVGKRGRTFGTKSSIDLVAEIENILEAVDEASEMGLMKQRARMDFQDEMWGIIPFSFGLAYTFRDVYKVVESVRKLQGIHPEVARCIAGIASALCAADSLDPLLLQDVDMSGNAFDLDRLTAELAAIRFPEA